MTFIDNTAGQIGPDALAFDFDNFDTIAVSDSSCSPVDLPHSETSDPNLSEFIANWTANKPAGDLEYYLLKAILRS